jgi:hypothetical protein
MDMVTGVLPYARLPQFLIRVRRTHVEEIVSVGTLPAMVLLPAQSRKARRGDGETVMYTQECHLSSGVAAGINPGGPTDRSSSLDIRASLCVRVFRDHLIYVTCHPSLRMDREYLS